MYLLDGACYNVAEAGFELPVSDSCGFSKLSTDLGARETTYTSSGLGRSLV